MSYYDNSQDGWVSDMNINASDMVVDMVSVGEDLLVFTDRQYMSLEGDPDDNFYYRGIPGSMAERYMPPITVMSVAHGSDKIMVLGKTAMGNLVAVSEDGGTVWSTTQLPITLGTYGRIRHFNGSFYIVSESDYLLVSVDGVTWDSYDLPYGFLGGSYWSDIRVADTYAMVLSNDSDRVLILEPDLTVRQEQLISDMVGTSLPSSIALGYQDKTVVAVNSFAETLFFTSQTAPGVFLPMGQDMTSDTWVNSATSQNQTSSVLIGQDGTVGMFYFQTGSLDTDELVSNPFTVLTTSDVFSNRQWVSATDFANKWYIVSFDGHVVSMDKDHVKVKEILQTGLTYCSAILNGWGKLFIFQNRLLQPGFVMYTLDPVSMQQTEYSLPYARTSNPSGSTPNSTKILFGAAFGDDKLVFLASDTYSAYSDELVYYAGICNSVSDIDDASAWTVVELDHIALNLPVYGDNFGFGMKIKFINGIFYALTTRGTLLRSPDGSSWTAITFSEQQYRYIDFSVTSTHIYVLTTVDVHRVDVAGTVFENSWHAGYFRNYNEELGVMLNHDDFVVVGSTPQNNDPYPPPSDRTPLLLAKDSWDYEYVLPTNLDAQTTTNPWPYWVNSQVSGTDAILLGSDLIGKINFNKSDWVNMVVTPSLTVYSGVEAVAAVKVGTSWYAFGNSVDKSVFVLDEEQGYWSSQASLSGDIVGEITQVFLINGQFHIFANSAGVYSMYSMDLDFTNITAKVVPSHIRVGYDDIGVFLMVCQDVDVNDAPVAYFSQTSSDMCDTWSNVHYFTEKTLSIDGTGVVVLLPSKTRIRYVGSKFFLITDTGITLAEPGNGSYDFSDYYASQFTNNYADSGDRKMVSMMYATIPQSGYDLGIVSGGYWNYDPVSLLPRTDLNKNWSALVNISNFIVAIRNGNGDNPEPTDGLYDLAMPMLFTTDGIRFWPIAQSGENLYTAAQWSDSFRSGNEAIVVSDNGYIAKLNFSALFP